MKKICSLAIVATLLLGFSACKKNAPSVENSNTFGVTPPAVVAPPTPDLLVEVGAIPTVTGSTVFKFTKKALIEEFTGEWCQWCPEGADQLHKILAANPNKVVGIAVHDGDPMELPTFNAWIKTLTAVSGYPNGSVDRGKASGRGSWNGEVATALTKPANLGIAMVTKTKNNLATIKVFIAYKNAIQAGTSLSVMITEDKVPQSAAGAQKNAPTSTAIVDANYKHGHVLRGVVTKDDGQYIALAKQEKYSIVEFKDVDLSKMNIVNMSNVSVVAFIHYNNDTRDVLNVQEAGLNEIKKWD